ncbi:unnamed protein product [Cyprideis torosa]|uniref:Uncharacterized protein n=1 Tax=Cyprideis torosa TaxID=163714 RepID=A0A7R8WJ57_9CRUS|nr:unnamed protein product [Cyprideis torosa]CAG0895386.1 unnamed protein product [Cyprideis torosa]
MKSFETTPLPIGMLDPATATASSSWIPDALRALNPSPLVPSLQLVKDTGHTIIGNVVALVQNKDGILSSNVVALPLASAGALGVLGVYYLRSSNSKEDSGKQEQEETNREIQRRIQSADAELEALTQQLNELEHQVQQLQTTEAADTIMNQASAPDIHGVVEGCLAVEAKSEDATLTDAGSDLRGGVKIQEETAEGVETQKGEIAGGVETQKGDTVREQPEQTSEQPISNHTAGGGVPEERNEEGITLFDARQNDRSQGEEKCDLVVPLSVLELRKDLLIKVRREYSGVETLLYNLSRDVVRIKPSLKQKTEEDLVLVVGMLRDCRESTEVSLKGIEEDIRNRTIEGTISHYGSKPP